MIILYLYNMMYSHVGFGRKANKTCRMDRERQLVGQSLNVLIGLFSEMKLPHFPRGDND